MDEQNRVAQMSPLKNRSLFEFVRTATEGQLPEGFSFPEKENPPLIVIEDQPVIEYGIYFHTEPKKRDNNAKIYKVIKEEVIEHCLVNGKKNTLQVENCYVILLCDYLGV